MRIDGQTRLTGIIGYPLRYTLSPVLHNAAFQHLGLNWCYVPLPVERPFLHQALEGVRALNFVGINVTMPYKEEVIQFLDEIASYARVVGAVNTIHVKGHRLIGYNTDGRGFLASLQRDAKFDPKGENVLIVGAGGAARSVAVSLALAGASYIAIVNRTLRRARSLSRLLRENFPSCEVEAMDFEADLSRVFLKAELVINATPVGMDPKSGKLPFPIELLNPKHLVCDLIYRPRETLLLKMAKEKGARTLGGLGMLLHQGAAAFEIWTNLEPPIEVMRKALEEALEEDRHGEG